MAEIQVEKVTPDEMVVGSIKYALANAINIKPNDRTEKDRRYAIVITEMEKIVAYFEYYVMQEK